MTVSHRKVVDCGMLYDIVLLLSRWVLPLLSVLLVLCWVVKFRNSRVPKATLAYFQTRSGQILSIHTQEGYIGRKRWCDVYIPTITISGKHAMFYEQEGKWYLVPLKGKVILHGRAIKQPAYIPDGSGVVLAGEEMTFCYGSPKEVPPIPRETGGGMLWILTIFQVVMTTQLCLRFWDDFPLLLPVCAAVLVLGQWIYYFICRSFNASCMLCEVPVLYLLTLGLAVCSCSAPQVLTKQLICGLVGAIGYLLLVLLLRNQQLCYRLRYVIALVTLGVLWFTVVYGTVINGSRNWLSIGGLTVQPSEFAKVAFLAVGSCSLYVATKKMDRLFFLIFSALLMSALVLMVDFGGILIFFVAMLIILLMRLMPTWMVGGMVAGAVAIGSVILLIFPHVAQRFQAWLHVWEYASSLGYQQTRTMIAAASGGLLGVGGGNGTLLGVAAADTDLVFGVLCEEWGGIVALCAALCFVALCVYAIRLAKESTCAFYAIGACGAAGMILFQTALNIFGSVDILPLTGVTMMFVSRGGTSLIAAFLMIAFFKAAERNTRISAERRRKSDESCV